MFPSHMTNSIAKAKHVQETYFTNATIMPNPANQAGSPPADLEGLDEQVPWLDFILQIENTWVVWCLHFSLCLTEKNA